MPVQGVTQFRNQLRKARDLAKEELKDLQIAVVGEGLRRVVNRSPVDRGRFRAAWQVTENRPGSAGPNQALVSEDPKGSPSVTNAVLQSQASKVAHADPFSDIYISNPVFYGEFLEQGSSDQAPEGMVAVTAAELNVIFT